MIHDKIMGFFRGQHFLFRLNGPLHGDGPEHGRALFRTFIIEVKFIPNEKILIQFGLYAQFSQARL